MVVISEIGVELTRESLRSFVKKRKAVTNTGSDPTAVLCDVDAYRASGKRIAAQVPVPVWIVQDPGVMWLKGHQRQTIRWFFDPHDAQANIGAADRFVATCRPNPSPPI